MHFNYILEYYLSELYLNNSISCILSNLFSCVYVCGDGVYTCVYTPMPVGVRSQSGVGSFQDQSTTCFSLQVYYY